MWKIIIIILILAGGFFYLSYSPKKEIRFQEYSIRKEDNKIIAEKDKKINSTTTAIDTQKEKAIFCLKQGGKINNDETYCTFSNSSCDLDYLFKNKKC